MPRSLTALFSSRASAEATRDRLVAAGISANEIDIQDQGTYAGGQTSGEHKGFMDGLKGMFSAHDDHQAYAEGITRGQVLLTATVKDNETDRAIQVLEASDAIDLDRQETEWRSSGWTGQATAGATDEIVPARIPEAVASATVPSSCGRPVKRLSSASRRSSPRRSRLARMSASAPRKCGTRCVTLKSTSNGSKVA